MSCPRNEATSGGAQPEIPPTSPLLDCFILSVSHLACDTEELMILLRDWGKVLYNSLLYTVKARSLNGKTHWSNDFSVDLLNGTPAFGVGFLFVFNCYCFFLDELIQFALYCIASFLETCFPLCVVSHTQQGNKVMVQILSCCELT